MAIPHADLMIGGGSSIQLLRTQAHLAAHDIDAEIFNPGIAYKAEEIDLVHLFGANMAMYDLALRMNDLKVKTVVSTIFYTLHNPWFLDLARRVENASKMIFKGIWTDYGVISAVCNACEAVLPNTSDEARLVEEGLKIPAEKIHVVPNGVDDRFFDATPDLFTETYGLKDFILYVGNMGSLRKNALSLINAASGLDVPTVLIGKTFDNPYGQQCIEAAEKADHIHILDPIPNESPLLSSAYAASKVFVLPGYFETPGIAALEAALAGSAIAITKYGGTKDYFRDQAVYLDPRSEKSIRNALQKSLQKGPAPGLRQRIYASYLWPAIAKQTAAIYHEVAS